MLIQMKLPGLLYNQEMSHIQININFSMIVYALFPFDP